MRTVSVLELRASCSAILKSVRDTKQPIRITHLGKTLAEIHPLTTGAPKKERLRTERDAREIEIINQNADQLNADALEGLSYGASPSKPPGPKRPKRRKAGNSADAAVRPLDWKPELSKPLLQLFEELAPGARDVDSAGDAAFAVFHALDDAGGLAALRAIGALGSVHDLLTVGCFCDLGAYCHD